MFYGSKSSGKKNTLANQVRKLKTKANKIKKRKALESEKAKLKDYIERNRR